MSYAGAVLMLIGAIFALLGAVGLFRFPDLYTRLHAASKAGPLGAGLIIVGAGVSTGEPFTVIRAGLGLVFLILVSPVSAHLLARAAIKSRISPNSITSINEMENSP